MLALRGAEVRAKEEQLRPFERLAVLVVAAVDQQVLALQRHSCPLKDELDDVAAEDLGLAAARRQEYLVAAGFQRIDQRLAREIPGRADLPAFQDKTRAVMRRLPPPVLEAEILFLELLLQQRGLLGGNLVGPRGLLRICIAIGDLGVKIGLVPAVAVPAAPLEPLDLAAKQVDLLEVLPALVLLRDQLLVAYQYRFLGRAQRRGQFPLLALLPARDRLVRDRLSRLLALEAKALQFVADLAQAPAPPVKRARLTADIGVMRSFYGGEQHGVGARCHPRAPASRPACCVNSRLQQRQLEKNARLVPLVADLSRAALIPWGRRGRAPVPPLAGARCV